MGGLRARRPWISLEDVQIAQQMYRRFIALMCALGGPSPTEAHAETLLFLRSDGPLYKCTRAAALWPSTGGGGGWRGRGGGVVGGGRSCQEEMSVITAIIRI